MSSLRLDIIRVLFKTSITTCRGCFPTSLLFIQATTGKCSLKAIADSEWPYLASASITFPSTPHFREEHWGFWTPEWRWANEETEINRAAWWSFGEGPFEIIGQVGIVKTVSALRAHSDRERTAPWAKTSVKHRKQTENDTTAHPFEKWDGSGQKSEGRVIFPELESSLAAANGHLYPGGHWWTSRDTDVQDKIPVCAISIGLRRPAHW
jgi:hypothetical protein